MHLFDPKYSKNGLLLKKHLGYYYYYYVENS